MCGFKVFITVPSFTVNKMGINQYLISSYVKCIMFSNNKLRAEGGDGRPPQSTLFILLTRTCTGGGNMVPYRCS